MVNTHYTSDTPTDDVDVFSRYAPFIQDYIYQSGWHALRDVQEATGRAIFTTDHHVLVCASTASGKTEAAFFPMLTLLDEAPAHSVGILYIAPLKALINDQFLRLDELCEQAHITVTKWHGDASQSAKRKLLKHPSGIVQITPESLESLLINRAMEIPSLFHDLRFVVIDEIHALLRADRGLQTFALIERLCRIAGCNPRRIGLSATIGDPQSAGAFLAAGSDRATIIPHIEYGNDVWRISMEHFYNSGPQADALSTDMSTESTSTKPVLALPQQEIARDIQLHTHPQRAHALTQHQQPLLDAQEPPSTFIQEQATDQAPEQANPGIGYIFEHTKGHKCLIFTNSREECEIVCQQLRHYCEITGEPDRFLIHHGNLSPALCQSAEEEMKEDDSLISICATATLELGIDIGKLERAFHLDAPFTVSGFLQRLGRTGRRGMPSEMWFVMREDPALARSDSPANTPWYLLQGIALIQLYAEEHFVEPARLDRLPYSLLYHQTMSTLASYGELSAAQLASRVLSLACFHTISQEDYRLLLRHLIATDHINLTESGNLIVGITGEKVVNNYKFYAVFQENIEFSVCTGSQELGTIVKPPPVGETIAIAGRVWVVEDIDYERHLVYCELVQGTKPAYFGDVPGDIHTRVLQRMAQVLRESTMYPYLLPHAQARLTQARSLAQYNHMAERPLIHLGGRSYALVPWLGTYAFLALERMLKIRCASRLGLKGLQSTRPYVMQFTMQVNEREFYAIVADELHRGIDPLELVYPQEVPIFEKYDQFVPAELVKKGFAYGVLDIQGMAEAIERWTQMFL